MLLLLTIAVKSPVCQHTHSARGVENIRFCLNRVRLHGLILYYTVCDPRNIAGEGRPIAAFARLALLCRLHPDAEDPVIFWLFNFSVKVLK